MTALLLSRLAPGSPKRPVLLLPGRRRSSRHRLPVSEENLRASCRCQTWPWSLARMTTRPESRASLSRGAERTDAADRPGHRHLFALAQEVVDGVDDDADNPVLRRRGWPCSDRPQRHPASLRLLPSCGKAPADSSCRSTAFSAGCPRNSSSRPPDPRSSDLPDSKVAREKLVTLGTVAMTGSGGNDDSSRVASNQCSRRMSSSSSWQTAQLMPSRTISSTRLSAPATLATTCSSTSSTPQMPANFDPTEVQSARALAKTWLNSDRRVRTTLI